MANLSHEVTLHKLYVWLLQRFMLKFNENNVLFLNIKFTICLFDVRNNCYLKFPDSDDNWHFFIYSIGCIYQKLTLKLKYEGIVLVDYKCWHFHVLSLPCTKCRYSIIFYLIAIFWFNFSPESSFFLPSTRCYSKTPISISL